ncbi:RINT1-like protein MAG2 isoform X2 [Mercurialis annua]|uniref:RINT1-like protein MAG2 isoform X2 n=1 Tax=Mercurialis annua TaxID=3986 RepID=UPI00215FA463|nr:RINT1-like protein MAG2 isoform X2 [Mercurialis annua]
MDSKNPQTVPHFSTLSTSAVSFLNERVYTSQDLQTASNLASELQSQCSELENTLLGLNSRLELSLVAYTSFSNQFQGLIGEANRKLTDLGSVKRSSTSLLSDEEWRKGQMSGEELRALAKEVARVETVRAYAETALKLDTLVGDIEDAVSSAINKNLRKHSSKQSSEEMRLLAIEALGKTETVLTSITKTRHQWTHLVSAVDHRVDRALAILRPQEIADHRALLSSLGWPPPLSTSTEAPNPLFTMQGDLKNKYCENFLALCRLQGLQRRRKSRQLEGHNREVALHQPLWAIEELVNPLSIACQQHFSKWNDKLDFIFALVYKITRDYVDTMDELLQPLVDEARLVGYSCREEWISAMVTSLLTYLAKEVFPKYISQLDEESVIGIQLQAKISFLHLLDLMISFDKRIMSLISHSGSMLSLLEDENLQKISSLSVFNDRPDWLDLWAEIELSETLEKLKPEVDDERNWTIKIQGAALLSGPENYKSPVVSSAFLRHISLVVDRCRSLPSTSLRSRFLRLAGLPLLQRFLDCVLLRCQEAEGLTALTDDNALIKVANSLNAAHYVESIIKEWCEDILFLEMGFDNGDPIGSSNNIDHREASADGPVSGIFDEEIRKLEDFRKEWVEKISVVVLRGFDARSRDYMKNKRQWQDKGEEGWTVSKSFVGALDYLQGKMVIVEENLNGIDFVGVWRSLAAGVDRLLFNGILMGNVKFHDCGVERLDHDLEVLFGVFGAWCLRPQGFFPKISDSLKLLKMGKKQFQDNLARPEKWMKEHGIRHLGVAEVEKILNSRVMS